jgi:hypothetical protein
MTAHHAIPTRYEHGAYRTLICGASLPQSCFGDALGWIWDCCWDPTYIFELPDRPGYGLSSSSMSYGDREG